MFRAASAWARRYATRGNERGRKTHLSRGDARAPVGCRRGSTSCTALLRHSALPTPLARSSHIPTRGTGPTVTCAQDPLTTK